MWLFACAMVRETHFSKKNVYEATNLNNRISQGIGAKRAAGNPQGAWHISVVPQQTSKEKKTPRFKLIRTFQEHQYELAAGKEDQKQNAQNRNRDAPLACPSPSWEPGHQ